MAKVDNERTRESIIVRGVCQTVLNMAYPSLKNLTDLIKVAFNEK